MTALSATDIATARELRKLDFVPWRIASLLGVEERLVLALLREDDAVVDVDEAPARPAVVQRPTRQPSWPPPADPASLWGEFVPRGSGEPVRARQVPLWGQQVWVDDGGAVWCPACQRFRSVAELGRPGNSCPVGIILPSGTILRLEPGDDGPRTVRGDGFMDAVWRAW